MSRRLRLSEDTVCRLVRIGDLPAVRVGRQWRFRPADLETWLAGRMRGAAADATPAGNAACNHDKE